MVAVLDAAEAAEPRPGRAARGAAGRGRRWLGIARDLGLAALGGLLLDLSLPGTAWWPLAFPAVAAMLYALRGGGIWRAGLMGLLSGAVFWGLQISWLTLYLGPIPWAAAAILMALWMGVVGALIELARRGLGAFSSAPWMRLGVVPAVVAGLWVTREAVSALWPYGGFSWGRVAMTQSESLFTDVVAWVGFNGLSFLLVWVIALAIELFAARRLPARALALRAAALAAVLAVLALVPGFPSATTGSVRVGAVQGDGPAAIFDVRDPGDVLESQVEATIGLLGEELDVVVWPEGAADLNPALDEAAAAQFDALSRAFDAPIVSGTVGRDGDEFFNSSIVWEAGEGVVGQYDKIHLVPFAEYMPNREFFHAIVPDLVDLVQLSYSFGERPNVVGVAGVPAGVMICFDITDDVLADRLIGDGAQLILAQTNNADFGETDETFQQLAITRLRAVETGRSIVNVSTVGVTEVIGPDGRTIAELPPFEPGALAADVPLTTTTTPAMAAGSAITAGVVVIGLGGLAAGIAGAFAARRRPPR